LTREQAIAVSAELRLGVRKLLERIAGDRGVEDAQALRDALIELGAKAVLEAAVLEARP
jgi:hypothetical protein